MNTPTPLTTAATKFANRTDFLCNGEKVFCLSDYIDISDNLEIRAAEIVRAVNYHDRLVDMLDRLSKAYEVAIHRIDFIKNSGNHEIAADNARKDNMVVAAQQLLTEIEKSNAND